MSATAVRTIYVCPSCGSPELEPKGRGRAGKRRVRCRECGARSNLPPGRYKRAFLPH